ncbi:FeoC-like transcriptional regulator [Streptomyces sp. NBC_01304]|uniref:FeoC-like transcriptional regulator n=1 Tax=Streptomyces sp. NBC_01304 TaxID=2903818 RepID=UPI002E1353A2|nr:FeoC-like transcriptional regulator [Streptomyces sp. NBC_01304]
MSAGLRDFLREFEQAAPGMGLAVVARRLGVTLDEARAMADYWVRKGRIERELVGMPDCSGCVFASRACTDCPSVSGSSPLVRLTLSGPSPERQ